MTSYKQRTHSHDTNKRLICVTPQESEVLSIIRNRGTSKIAGQLYFVYMSLFFGEKLLTGLRQLLAFSMLLHVQNKVAVPV